MPLPFPPGRPAPFGEVRPAGVEEDRRVELVGPEVGSEREEIVSLLRRELLVVDICIQCAQRRGWQLRKLQQLRRGVAPTKQWKTFASETFAALIASRVNMK